MRFALARICLSSCLSESTSFVRQQQATNNCLAILHVRFAIPSKQNIFFFFVAGPNVVRRASCVVVVATHVPVVLVQASESFVSPSHLKQKKTNNPPNHKCPLTITPVPCRSCVSKNKTCFLFPITYLPCQAPRPWKTNCGLIRTPSLSDRRASLRSCNTVPVPRLDCGPVAPVPPDTDL